MEILLNVLLLIAGFALLIKGADIFVDGSSSTASNFKVPKILIGLTIIAFGTSAPELAVSLSALASGSPDMVIGNVMGSCILNILLILGVAAVIRPIQVKSNTVKKELPLCFLISAALSVLFLDGMLGSGEPNAITRADGLVLILFFCVFLYYLFTLAFQKTDGQKAESKKVEPPKFPLGKSLLFIALGLAGIIIGSQLVVDNATALASVMGMSERVIALTVIALGTSLPELVTTIVASRKGEQDLVVGNIIGSNIFNICLVLGLPAVIFGGVVPSSFQILDVAMLMISALVIFGFACSGRKVTRNEGIIMLILFALYYGTIIVT